MEVDRTNAKLQARDRLKEQLGSSAGAFIITGAIAILATVGVPLVGGLVCPSAAILGYNKYNLNLANKNKPRAASVFEGFDNTIKAMFLTLYTLLFITLWALTSVPIALIGLIFIVRAPEVGIILMILAVAWAVFISIYKSLQYSLSFWVLADNPDIGVVAAVEQSKNMTFGHIGDLFVFTLSFIGWFFLVVIFLPCILYVIPYYSASFAYLYNQLKGTIFIGSVSSKPTISCITGSYCGSVIDIEPNEEIIIGRDASVAHMILSDTDDRISRKHCGIVYDENRDKFGVIDYSKHGTFLENGTRISTGTYIWLNRGTVIYLVDRKNMFSLN